MSFRRTVLLASIAAGLLACGANADEPDPRNRADFQVERTRDVANDQVRAVVGITDEGADPAALADRVNRTMAWGLAKAKGAQGVEVKSGGYNTSPVYQDGKIRRWRASQDLIIESEDVDAVSALVGTLQERLQLRSIGFSVSPERRRGVEDELIQEAMAAFRARADLVQDSMGARGWSLVRVSINTGGGGPPRPYYAAEARMAAASPAPPALEGGTSRLTVNVNGTVELE